MTTADELLICRCEEVSLAEIEKAIESGAISVNEVKRMTRAGMGLCQGRMCGRVVRQIIAQRKGTPIDQVEPGRVRAPLRPIKISVLARSDEDARRAEGTPSTGRVDATTGEGRKPDPPTR